MHRIFLLLVAIGTISISAMPQEQPDHDLNLAPTYMALFKNGLGLVVSEIEIPDASGTYQVFPLPDAILGSFWVGWSGNIYLNSIVATTVEQATRVPTSNIRDLVAANIGKTVWMYRNDPLEENEAKLQKVKIIDVPLQNDNPIILPFQRNIIPPPSRPPFGEFVIIEDVSQEQALPKEYIPIHWVQSLQQAEESEISLEIERTQQVPAIQFQVESDQVDSDGNGEESTSVFITYIAKGASWSPSYVVDITEDATAIITCKAVIINDLITMENSEVELVSGYPHIKFQEQQSPFSLQSLREFMEKLGRGVERVQEFGLRNQALGYYAGDMVVAARAMPAPSMPVQGESVEDLYFYQLDEISLKKGERGYYPLFAEEVPYQHLYTWEIPNYMNYNQQYQESPEIPQDVWHTLKLTNTTNQPWTTAPATTMKDNRILGQDQIEFTPPGAETKLIITKASSIKAEQDEVVINRQFNAQSIADRMYNKLTVRGELLVTNYLDEPVQLEVTKHVLGDVLESSGDAEITKAARGLREINTSTKIVWNLEVQPGRDNQASLDYTYEVYAQ
ncbi:MAG: hypothetical protein ACOX5R_21355 [bacterium]|jgi:hypothetical protein